jgi:F0F1-type ATP synthase assembly protein I
VKQSLEEMSVGRDRRKLNPGFLEALQFYTSVTMRIGVSLLLGFLAGYALDSRLGTQPWLAIIGFFIGVSLGVWSVYDMIRLTFKKKSNRN